MHGDEFLKRMGKRDPTVWDDLMPMLRRIVLGACSKLGVYDSIKEDVMQDVAIQVITKWQTYSGQSALTTWLYAIARHRCLDELRSRKVRGESHSRKTNSDDDASASSPPEPRYDAKFELMLCVQQLLAELNAEVPKRRNSPRMIDVLLFWVKHCSTMEELAEFLKTTVQAAKQRLYEIRKHIKKLCQKYCGHEDCSLESIIGSDS
jgi:RNA polymerase sigma factor (sigma-70 family)